jgi:hypothetical protein
MVTQQLAKKATFFLKKSPLLARQHPVISLKPEKNPREARMLTENGSQNLVSAAHDSTRKLRGPMHREDERTARIAEVKLDSASYPLGDAVGICCLPTPSPHLWPRRRRLLGHGSLPWLRLRVEHLDLLPRERCELAPAPKFPNRNGEKKAAFIEDARLVLLRLVPGAAVRGAGSSAACLWRR